MTNVDWNSVCSSKKKYDSDVFLRVKPNCKLKVRLIGLPVKVVKIFTTDRKCIVLKNEETAKQLKEKYPDKLGNISIRYASLCLDRNDNSLKILDMPLTVARGFGNRELLVGKKISNKTEGCDWSVITNGKQGKDVRYEVVYIEETPLSEDEVEMVKTKRASDNGNYDLRKIFKTSCFEDAEEKLLNG